MPNSVSWETKTLFIQPTTPFPVGGALSGAGGLDEIQTLSARAKNGEEMSKEDLRKIGQKFESLLLHQLLSTMRKSIPESPLFGDSQAQKMYWDMFDESMAENAAAAGSTGITDAIVEELSVRSQDVRPPKGDNPFRPLGERTHGLQPLEATPVFRPIPREHDVFTPIPEREIKFRPLPGRSPSHPDPRTES